MYKRLDVPTKDEISEIEKLMKILLIRRKKVGLMHKDLELLKELSEAMEFAHEKM